ncbi:hypothetical protein NDU88_004810 [Pleurodeles waltl]|uniref:Reverse transcriptase domain-containing protein n=1 Tax=Pleurodeles waltl TaxID=8319 RepID=A0AAV7WYX7_PLEWA|nr:hypothetical protein NDU88_004810 [Pleurodeles waltl]
MVDQAKEIGKVFLAHYTNTYTPKSATSDELIYKFLGSVSLLSLDQELQSALLQPITKAEAEEATRDSPKGKAAGEDGLPVEVYKILSEQIAATLATLFNAVLNGEKVPSSFTWAVIVSFLKKVKPGEKPDSYHFLRQDNSIKRLMPGAPKLKHFADDAILYLEANSQKIEKAFSKIQMVSNLGGYQFNKSKSKALLFNTQDSILPA